MDNLYALMLNAQQAQRSPTTLGPIAPQQLAPGFRMPPEVQMRAPPPPQDPGFSVGLGMLPHGSYDPNGYYNNLGGKPGGYSSIDDLLSNATHVDNPAGADPNSPGLFGRIGNWFQGLF